MSALGEDLALVLIDGVDEPERVAVVDEAVAGALEALEVLGDDPDADELLEAVVALVAQVLVDLRSGLMDRVACRVAAALTLERLEQCTGMKGRDEPVRVLLAALAAVPERGSDPSRSLDPAPAPDLPVEVALAGALSDPTQRPALLDVLATSAVHLPVLHTEVLDEELAIRFLPLVLRDGVAACAFTHPEHFSEVAVDGTHLPILEVTGAELSDLWPPGHDLALNPGSVLGTVISEREVRSLADRVQ